MTKTAISMFSWSDEVKTWTEWYKEKTSSKYEMNEINIFGSGARLFATMTFLQMLTISI